MSRRTHERSGSFSRRSLLAADGDAAKTVRLPQDRFENRREIAGRAVDDVQHLCGRGLPLQRLSRFAHEARILDRDEPTAASPLFVRTG